MKIKKWLFFIILLCSSATVSALPKQNFTAWITHEMQHKHIPGVSIAVIKNYRIEWAKGFGVADKKTREPMMPNILFQAGSISKPVTAMAVLKLVQNGKLKFDENINSALMSWKMPDNMIVQQALMEVERQPFTQVMNQLVLKPLDMSRSTFLQPLPSRLMKHIATPYWTNGHPVPDVSHTYPEQAAAGLWTTPADLAKFVISIQKSLKGDSGQILTQHSAELMAVNMAATTVNHHLGLGFNVQVNKYGKPVAKGAYFSAMGQNEGYSSLLIGSVKNGNGLVIMINASPDHRIADSKKNQPSREFISAVVKKVVNTEGWS